MSDLLTSLSDNIVIDKDKCVFCGVCVDTCITDNLRLQLAPCRGACPLRTNCQGYVQAVARGDDSLALQLVHKKLPFPAILGRVCAHPCETACHRNETDGQAVAIREIKRYISDRVPIESYPTPTKAPDTGKRIAVVGAGPAGLLAAYDLALRGHEVQLYDSEEEAGGMLRWAIPAFRLSLATLDKELGQLDALGVAFHGGQRLGETLDLATLSAENDATVVAVGCSAHRVLAGFDEGSQGMHYGLPFLRRLRRGESVPVGENIVVIGGGNVAVDAARSAKRLGAKRVQLVCLEQRPEMPAYPWEVGAAEDEGVEIVNGWGPVAPEFRDSTVTGVALQRCTAVLDNDGHFAPQYDKEVRQTLKADTIIVAVGQSSEEGLLERLGISEDVDPLTLQLGDQPVFLAGDMVSGPSSVVEAMAQGRRAAESAHRLVLRWPIAYERAYAGPVVTEFSLPTDRGVPVRRRAEAQPRPQCHQDFDEADVTFDRETAKREAERCHSCGQPVGYFRTCWFCLPCEVECPHEALWVEVPYLLR